MNPYSILLPLLTGEGKGKGGKGGREMNLANWFNLTNSEFLLILAGGGMIVSFLTLVSSIYFGWRFASFRRSRDLSQDPDPLQEWRKESESICQTLSKNLDEKREISRRLIEDLDGRIQSIRLLLNRMEEKEQTYAQGTNRKDLHTQIVEMAGQGYGLSEIAQRANLTAGEVQLILNLRKYSHQ
jgi:hypothetical protein